MDDDFSPSVPSEPADGESFFSWWLPALTNFYTTLSERHPMLVCALTLVLAWAMALKVRSWFGGTRISQERAVDKAAAMAAARERQQQLLDSQAAARRLQQPAPPRAAPVEEEAAAEAMPDRMAAALRRRLAAEDGGAGPSSPPPSSQKKKGASYTERLEKIQKGKGPSDHNPLQGHPSERAGSVVCRKKGG